MPLSGQKLSQGAQGDDVKQLHAALAQLGYAGAIPADELIAASYGKGTAQAVANFQTKNGLQPTAEVDEATAKAINTLTAPSQSAVNPPTPNVQPGDFVVHGHIRMADGVPAVGVEVRAYDKDLPSLKRDLQLGASVTTDKSGYYEIHYTSDQFARAEAGTADLFVHVFDSSSGKTTESSVLFNAPAEATLDVVVPLSGKGFSEYERVSAAVAPLIESVLVADLTPDDVAFLANETGLNQQWIELLVTAHRHQAAISDEVKVTAAVDASAFYGLMREGLPTELLTLLAQDPQFLRDALKRAAGDNIIPELSAGQLDTIIAQLKALRVRFDLRLPGKNEPSPLGIILGTSLPQFDQQAAFLSLYHDHQGEIGEFWDKLKETSEFAAEGLVSQIQFSLQLAALTSNNAALVKSLREDSRLKSTKDLIDIDAPAWKERIQATVGNKGEGIPPNIKGTTVEEKIGNYAGYIVETLKSAFPTAYVVKGMAKAPDVDVSLLKQIRESNPALDLKRYFRGVLKAADFKFEAKTQAALEALRTETTLFPALDAESAISGDQFHNPIRNGVNAFFANAPDFDFADVNIEAYVREKGDTVFAGIAKEFHEPVKDQLKTLQRVYQVVPRFESITALMESGFHSAQDMTALPTDIFKGMLKGQLRPMEAQLIQENATRIADYNALILSIMSSATSNDTPRVIRKPEVSEDLRATYANLFGRLSLCECKDCRSVYSPAAYFVDLLHFLDPKPEIWNPFILYWRVEHEFAPYPFRDQEAWTKFLSRWHQDNPGAPDPDTERSPFQVLTDRRPDLTYLKLTCENTNTLIPYIDLVNEVLESYVVHHTTLDSNIVDDVRVVPSAELMATPEHVNGEAYKALKRAVYPFKLPFDRDLETIRAYLAHLGTSRYAVMKTFQQTRPITGDAQTDLAVEYLGIGPDERNILTGAVLRGDPPPHTLADLYGYSESTDSRWREKLGNVAIFEERTAVTYEELTEILKTRFINPASLDSPDAVVINDPGNSCDPAERTLELKKRAPLTDEVWDKLQRFVRLRRPLGWSIHDVDRALTAFGVTNVGQFNLRFLRQLGQAVQLRDDLDLSLTEVVSFWAPIDTHGNDIETRQRSSLYARLFLTRSIRELAKAQNAFDFPSSIPDENPIRRITENAAAIQAALRITADDVKALRKHLNLEDPPSPIDDRTLFPPISLENLSLLHRYAVLSRGLHIPIRHMLDLETLSGIRPFSIPPITPGNGLPTAQEGTQRFVELARKFQRSGFSIGLLNYLYRHTDDPANSVALRDDELLTRLESLRGGLKKMVEEATPPGTEDEQLRKLLARVFKDDKAIEAVLALPDGARTFAVPLPTRPVVTFPPELGSKIGYNATGKTLWFVGAMTNGERDTLLSLPGADEVYRAAIRRLHTDSSMLFALFTAPLDSAPSVVFPSDLSEKIAYRVADKLLCFDGVMTDSEKGSLLSLLRSEDISTAAEAYRKAINQLFEQPRKTIISPLAGPLTGAEIITNLIGDHSTSIRSRLAYFKPKALDYLCTGFVFQNLTEAMQLDEKIVSTLLTRTLHSRRADSMAPLLADFLGLRDLNVPEGSTVALDPLYEQKREGYTLVYKSALLVKAFDLTLAEVVYLATPRTGFGGFDFNDLPLKAPPPPIDEATLHANFAAWVCVCDLVALRKGLRPDADLVSVLGAPNIETAKKALLTATGWDEAALDSALVGSGGFNVTEVTWFADLRHLSELKDAMDLSRQIGANLAQLFAWATGVPTPDQVREVQSTVKAKYDEQQWLAVAKSLNDPLRERRRDALVAYVLTLPNIKAKGIRTSNELFEHFLIDVDMGACMATSRVKQAISSVQLFIQRCFMNLELVAPNVLRKDRWEWMSHYRVWEANRKVFLYPENWIEPELRDDKSPFFKDLENELLQNEVTDDTAEAAFLGYLEKLDEVARLDIRGMYWEHESELITWDDRSLTQAHSGDLDISPGTGEFNPADRADILHVFGRTQNTPPIYYYRRLINHTTWTPWEKVPADIEGDHLIPVVYNRRLYLFWPIFRDITDPDQAPPQQGEAAHRPEKRLGIKLAWSENKDGKWSAKKLTTTNIETYYVPEEYRNDFFFDAQQINGVLSIACKRWADIWELRRRDSSQVLSTAFVHPGTELPQEFTALEQIWSLLVGALRSVGLNAKIPFIIDNRNGYMLAGTFNISGCDSLTRVENNNVEIVDRMLWPRQPWLSHASGQTSQANESTQTNTDTGPVSLTLTLPINAGGTRVFPTSNQFGWPETLLPSRFRLLFPHQYSPYSWQDAPFFYLDDEHNYFVTPDYRAEMIAQVRSPTSVRIAYPATLLLQAGQLLISSTNEPQKDTSGDHHFNDKRRVGKTTVWGNIAVCPDDRSNDYTSTPGPRGPLKLRFHIFYHPYVCEFIKALKRQGVTGLLTLDIQERNDSGSAFRTYRPTSIVNPDIPVEEVNFRDGTYALYNWELFFHIPLLIATRLSANQRFEEARRWFHFIFDPTTDSTDPIPSRYWKTLPFYQNKIATHDQIGELLELLSYRGNTTAIVARKEQVEAQVQAWRDDPFNPHHIARVRITAYQKTVVMKYIDTLLAGGDQLFRQDTIETINQATQLYVLAYLMLGKRPEIIKPSGKLAPKSYVELRPELDAFSNALIATENTLGGRGCPLLTKPRKGGPVAGATLGALYFCVPSNDKLLGYWDLVEDRLFKIRHCMNIEGVVRQLPLFEPPIDPALLVRARAAGLDLSSILNDLHAGLPHYRFAFTLQKALEFCGEVRSLGAALLAAYEKKDGEELALLRSSNEVRLLDQMRLVRQKQIEEAQEAIEGLEKSKLVIQTRFEYYRDIQQISVAEGLHLELQALALELQLIEQITMLAAPAAYQAPNMTFGIAGWAGSPVSLATWGGKQIGSGAESAAKVLGILASAASTGSSMAGSFAGYERRWDEWKLQERLADRELDQVDKQIKAAQIREAISQQDLANHELQIEQANAVDEFMRSRKFTRKDLYDWMVNQLAAVYFQAYQLAYDLAKRAERAYQFERGVATSNFIRFGQWDSLHRGLLAGEQLTLDLKRLESAYLDQNRREYEITKHVSLVLHDPLALITLKTTGQCVVRLLEALFDADYPGHYMRRIKGVSLTIPAVVGPYTSVNCTLTLLSSKIRVKPSAIGSYPESQESDDDRFIRNFAAVQSIATSHAQNDTGLFELNFRDERYLPFEGAGVISEWLIEMPKDTNAFDFDTITDVVLRLNYTARDGGNALRQTARAALNLTQNVGALGSSESITSRRLFSLKHEFATEWFRFLQAPTPHPMQFDLTPDRFPYQFRQSVELKAMHIFLIWKTPVLNSSISVSLMKPGNDPADHLVSSFNPDNALGGLPHATLEGINTRLYGDSSPLSGYTWSLSFTWPTDVTVPLINAGLLEDILLVCEIRH